MGQGTESCGGYEVDYDPYEDGLADGYWTQRNRTPIHVEDMSLSHLKNARKVAQEAAETATFTCDEEKWLEWVDLFDAEIWCREQNQKTTPKKPAGPKKPQRGSKTSMICHCGAEYQARNADLKRGWALSCSKRCAAIRRDFGRPAAKRKG